MQQYRPQGFSVLPPVVKNLLIINALFFFGAFVLEISFNYDLVRLLGLHYPLSEDFGVWQFITYMFMHQYINPATGGLFIWHILLNMFALWMFGNALENVWGGKRFLNYYLITGIGAGLIQMLVAYIRIRTLEAGLTLDEIQVVYTGGNVLDGMNIELMTSLYQMINTPTVGASGAVFGILLAFGMMFPNSLIYVYFAIPVKAKYFVMIYGAFELYSGISNNAGDNVAHFAHLGGMVFGIIMILYWKRKGTLYS